MLQIKIGIFALAAYTLALCLDNSVYADLSCLDEQGEPVDWFVGYKFPKLKVGGSFQDGVAYSYITSRDVENGNSEIERKTVDLDSTIFIYKFKNLLLKYLGYKAPKKSMKKPKRRIAKTSDTNSRWVASDYTIGDPNSILMRTLAPAYEKESSSISSVFYNDEPSNLVESNYDYDSDGEPKKTKKNNNARAHAKGVLLMDEKSMNGLWLTHSVPKFPDIRKSDLVYPSNGILFGQTFMCVSFKVADSAKKLVDHLVNMRVLVYDNQISDKFYEMIPALRNLDTEEKIKGRRIRVEPTLSQMITTRGGQVLHLFSKSADFGQDMYSGWIDKELGADLYVETWRRGSGNPLDSFCPMGDYHVNNVKDLKYDQDVQWNYLNDHSKWAISEVVDDGIVCIADSNRMESQFKRGGGAVCIKCPFCWNVFSNTIQDFEPCPKDRSRFPKSEPKDAKGLLQKIREALHL